MGAQMTDAQMEILMAEIGVELTFTIPPYINGADQWIDAVNEAQDAIREVIKKHNKEGLA